MTITAPARATPCPPSSTRPEGRWSNLVRDMAVNVATEVAGYDPAVVDILMRGPLGRLLDPRRTLVELGATYGWNDDPGSPPGGSWELGTAGEVDGMPVRHAAAVVTPVVEVSLVRRRCGSGGNSAATTSRRRPWTRFESTMKHCRPRALPNWRCPSR